MSASSPKPPSPGAPPPSGGSDAGASAGAKGPAETGPVGKGTPEQRGDRAPGSRPKATPRRARPRGARRTSLPLLLAITGLVASLLAPGTPAAWLPLVFCPGWGLARLVSVIDRNFGVLGSALCLSPLVLGGLTMLSAALGWSPRDLATATQIASVGLCVLGRVRMAAYDRWLSRQPPVKGPMPWWPERVWACAAILVAAVAAVAHVVPTDEAALGTPRVHVASDALAWIQGAEDPLRAGRPLPLDSLLACAAAGLANAGGVHPLEAVQLLSMAALAACLVLAAESISRLWGNRGGVLAMTSLLLGLNPLAVAFLLGVDGPVYRPEDLTADFSPQLTTALSPFLDGSPLALALAFTAMLLSTTLSVLRRSSTHVPRLATLATLGLVLTEPRAAMLLLPGWIVGLFLAHLACRDSADNDPQLNTSVRRPGEPRILRAPFWRPALHVAVGAAAGFALVGQPDFDLHLSRVVIWGLVAAVGPGCILFMPGVRHLNASPGREAYFFLPVVVVTALLGATVLFPGDDGNLVVRLLALVLAVPAANGAMKVIELHGLRAVVLLVFLVIVTLPGPLVVLRAAWDTERLLQCVDHDSVVSADLTEPLAAALSLVHDRSATDAVLVLDAPLADHDLHAIYLLSGRPLVVPPREQGVTDRHTLVRRLAGGDGTALSRLRGLPGLAGREMWGVHLGDSWPGFESEEVVEDLRVERARLPDVVLVTISGLRVDRLDEAHMPRLAARAERGLLFETAITPTPETLPGLATLLSGLSPVEHDVRDDDRRLAGDIPGLQRRLAARGYRSSAVVALEAGSGLLAGFEHVLAEPDRDADSLVELALQQLSLADPRPVFLWLHLADLALPYRVPEGERTAATGADEFPRDADLAAVHYGVATHPPAPGAPGEVDVPTGVAQYDALVRGIDRALGRLLLSVPDDDLLTVTAPHGTSLDEHGAYFLHGPDLFEPSIHVPLVVCGGGMPVSRSGSLASLADIPDLLLEGRLPVRERVLLESGWRPGLGTGAAWPAAIDPTARGLARRIWGERTSTGKTLLTVEPLPGREADGVAYDLATDPDEMHGTPADPFALRRVDTWRRRGRPASVDVAEEP